MQSKKNLEQFSGKSRDEKYVWERINAFFWKPFRAYLSFLGAVPVALGIDRLGFFPESSVLPMVLPNLEVLFSYTPYVFYIFDSAFLMRF